MAHCRQCTVVDYSVLWCASGLIKGLASPSQGERRQKGEEEDGGVTSGQRKQAWGEESVESPRQVRCSDFGHHCESFHECLHTLSLELCSHFGGCTMFVKLLKG